MCSTQAQKRSELQRMWCSRFLLLIVYWWFANQLSAYCHLLYWWMGAEGVASCFVCKRPAFKIGTAKTAWSQCTLTLKTWLVTDFAERVGVTTEKHTAHSTKKSRRRRCPSYKTGFGILRKMFGKMNNPVLCPSSSRPFGNSPASRIPASQQG